LEKYTASTSIYSFIGVRPYPVCCSGNAETELAKMISAVEVLCSKVKLQIYGLQIFVAGSYK